MILGILLRGVLKEGFDRLKAHVSEWFTKQVGFAVGWCDL